MKTSHFVILLALLAAVFIGRYIYLLPKQKHGDIAADFNILYASDSIQLQDLRGQWVLLDFWGSWCAPCLEEIPFLKALHETYGSQGLQIVSIAVEQDAGRYERATERLTLPWKYQMLDLSSNLRIFNGPVAQLYEIHQIPTTLLIGPNGEVEAVNPSRAALKAVLDNALLPKG